MITSNIKEKDNLLLSEKMKLFYNKVCEQLAQTKESDIENILIQNNDGDSKVMNFEEDYIFSPLHFKLVGEFDKNGQIKFTRIFTQVASQYRPYQKYGSQFPVFTFINSELEVLKRKFKELTKLDLSKQLQEITLETLKERVVGGFAHNLFGQELAEDYGFYCLNESDDQDAKDFIVEYCLFLKNKKVISSKTTFNRPEDNSFTDLLKECYSENYFNLDFFKFVLTKNSLDETVSRFNSMVYLYKTGELTTQVKPIFDFVNNELQNPQLCIRYSEGIFSEFVTDEYIISVLENEKIYTGNNLALDKLYFFISRNPILLNQVQVSSEIEKTGKSYIHNTKILNLVLRYIKLIEREDSDLKLTFSLYNLQRTMWDFDLKINKVYLSGILLSGKKVEINNSLEVEGSLFKEPKDFWKHHSQELDDKLHTLNNYRNLPSVIFTEGAEHCLKLFEMQIQYLELLQKGE